MCVFCNVRVCVCVGFVMFGFFVCVVFLMCVCVCFVMFGFVYVWVFNVLCKCVNVWVL